MGDKRRLLLLSSSRVHGSGYLEHASQQITSFLGSIRSVLFVPYALQDLEAYAAEARDRFAVWGYRLESIHLMADPKKAIGQAEALFIGGGNTFRLLKRMYDLELLDPIRSRVADGMPYLGASAGSNVACPAIKTTNDMPIVQPPSFAALGLIPFQINPHYLDPDPTSTHEGETREQRIREFHEENSEPVVGLREGALLRIENGSILLEGISNARLFRAGVEPTEFLPGTDLTDNLK